jgi:hypothetical protein
MITALRLANVLVVPLVLTACPADDDEETGGGSGSSESSGTSSLTTTTSMSTTLTTSDTSTTMPSTTTDATEDTGSTGEGSGTDPDSSSGGSDDSSSGSAACTGMTFFASSSGSGDNGGNLGGTAGADATCQALADAVGQGDCTWHAYLSTADEDARDRIGAGPWFNFDGDILANDVDALHARGFQPNGDPDQLIFDENGSAIPGNEHDILTGSQANGTLLDGSTCDDWTSDTGGAARVGHSDIPENPQFSPSWNSAHDTPACDPDSLAMVGGAGRLYCFAIDG